MISDYDICRTLSIVRELSLGKTLTLPSGHTIGMGDDLSIGYIMTDHKGGQFIGGLATMDLKALNRILTENDIGMVIPSGRIRKEGY
jgi:hypothetical protein